MTNRGVLVAAGTLVIANVLILGGVMRNRSGTPDAALRLSERELESWGDQSDGAETFLNLRLRWAMATGPDGRPWFDREKLEALGVTDLPAPDDTSFTMLGWRGARRTYVVLELAGPAWERWKAAKQAAADSTAATRTVAMAALPPEAKPLLTMDTTATRLMAVNLGPDPLALRGQYPDRSRYLILPATYRLDVAPPERDSLGKVTVSHDLAGTIGELLPGTVHVPRPLRDSLLALGVTRHDSTVHFEITLKVGKKWEAWVE